MAERSSRGKSGGESRGDRGLRALVVVDEDGAILEAILTNGKGFTKSRERDELWAIDPVTGRLLPYRGGIPFTDLRMVGDHYEAVVERAQFEEAAAKRPAGRRAGEDASGEPGASEAGSDGAPRPHSGSPQEGTGSATDVLLALERLVRERREELPEGSYTTHLFREGEEKIRKKAGEEAIELLLARGEEELVSESSDFLYHLLVLLAARGIPLERVVSELETRLDR